MVVPDASTLASQSDISTEFERFSDPLPRSTHVSDGPAITPPNKIDLANRRLGMILDDKWKLDRLLGVGGMAAVYAATHRNGAQAAIKLLPFSMATGPEVCQRLLREGYLANRIQHSAVARVLDDHIDYAKEHAYIVMELLDGETARQRVERLGPFRPRQAVALMQELADCLAAAHAANVIHRDIKPENLFLTENGLKVLDFGIARALDGNSSLTQTGTSLGTPAYMSPEQARGKQADIGPRSDLYSVGATLLFLLTGQTPHRGENALELMVRAAWTPAESARKLCPGLPEALADVIDRCCAFEPAERYQSAQELRDALDRLTNLPQAPLTLELTFTPTPTNNNQALPVSSSDMVTLAETAVRGGAWSPSRRRGAALVAGLVSLAGLGWWGMATEADVAPDAVVETSVAPARTVSEPAAPEPVAADLPKESERPTATPSVETRATKASQTQPKSAKQPPRLPTTTTNSKVVASKLHNTSKTGNQDNTAPETFPNGNTAENEPVKSADKLPAIDYGKFRGKNSPSQ